MFTFTFLTRLGRLAVGIPIVIAVTTIMGFSVLNIVPVASHHQASASAACVVASTGVGRALVTSGHGFAANSQYLLAVKTPAGTGTTTATTDASGSFTVNAWATWAGTYSAAVWTMGGGSHLMASCSSVTV
jgi:hypothetical protein